MDDTIVFWSDEHLQLILDAWEKARIALIERFPYGKEFVGTRPDIMNGLIHDGNGAYCLVRSAITKDEPRWKRQNRGIQLKWFARFAEYVLEKETVVTPKPRPEPSKPSYSLGEPSRGTFGGKWSNYFNHVIPGRD